jgi:uncharacterized Zn finger protein
MPSRITPLDVKAFAPFDLYRKGEQIFENDLVKHRFQTHFGLQATVRGKGNYKVEMIVDGEQVFGRCTCHVGSTPCEHQVAILLSWVNEPSTFTSYQTLRKAIRLKDKSTLIDVLINLIEAFPDISSFFLIPPGVDETEAVREDVANIFDLPHSEKIDPSEIIEPFQILFVRTKLLRNEGKYQIARIILFEFLNRTLALLDWQQTSASFQENFIAEIADDYEEIALADPEFEEDKNDIQKEVEEILEHESASTEGVFLDQLCEKLGIEQEK